LGRTARADSALFLFLVLAAALSVALVVLLAALIALVLSTRLVLSTLARPRLPRLALPLILTLRKILRHREDSFRLPLSDGEFDLCTNRAKRTCALRAIPARITIAVL
jgi:hypothetical protein